MNFNNNNDPFEEIVREFFGSRNRPDHRSDSIIQGESEERVIDFIEDSDYAYLVFELPGYLEKDIRITMKGRDLEITAKKTNTANTQSYFLDKFTQGISIRKTLPRFINPKNPKHFLRNGILEIMFIKK